LLTALTCLYSVKDKREYDSGLKQTRCETYLVGTGACPLDWSFYASS